MSYQARISAPPLRVTGRMGAFGNTKRSGAFRFSMGMIGSKSWASAPRPCIQMTLPTGASPDSTVTHSKLMGLTS